MMMIIRGRRHLYNEGKRGEGGQACMSLSWEIGVDPPKQIGSGESGRVLRATLHSRKTELYHKAKQRSVPLCFKSLNASLLLILPYYNCIDVDVFVAGLHLLTLVSPPVNFPQKNY